MIKKAARAKRGFGMSNIGFELSQQQENELLWMVNGISFDFTLLFDREMNRAEIVRFQDGNRGSSFVLDNFEEYLLQKIHPDDQVVFETILSNARDGCERLDFEVRLLETAGRRYRWHSVHVALNERDGHSFYVGSSTYIDNRKSKENELTIKARQDPLTGLLNKVITQENINLYIKRNPEKPGVLIVLDIDNFKNYNDCIGHLFGDEVIKEVSRKLMNVFSDDSFVGRIGGDEFCVFIKDSDDISGLVSRMGQLRDSLKEIKLGQKSKIEITTSVGMALYPDHGLNFESLFERADMALYHVKNNGKNSFVIYTEDLYNERIVREADEKTRLSDEISVSSITDFAFHLLNESADSAAAINLLLYKMMNEYGVEAIYVNELIKDAMAIRCTHESVQEDGFSRLGERAEFSYEALDANLRLLNENGGYYVYDMARLGKFTPGNRINEFEQIKSVLQIDMRLFSKSRGCVNIASSRDGDFWNINIIREMVGIVNLLTVCLYYTGKITSVREQMEHLSDYDSLTGLMKEEPFVGETRKLINAKQEKSTLAFVYCDIVNFKHVNETYGYMAGDEVLKNMSEYITTRVPGVLISCRFHSDNFISLMEFPKDTGADRIRLQVDSIGQEMSEFLTKRQSVSKITIRAGVFVVSNESNEPVEAISNANMARKIAKEGSGNRCVLFSRSMFEEKKRDIQYIQALDEAIANEEFFVCLQPKVAADRKSLEGAEALVRWKRQNGETLMPAEFIPTFEKDGSIVKLDFYVYEKVFKYLRNRIDENKPVVPISMNVSRVHLVTPDFTDKFTALVDKYKIPTGLIELEITESVYLENLSEFDETVNKLRQMGIKISMDDFGSGYSSLNALNDLKFDLLKIDKIFMRDKSLSAGDRTIIKFIIEMAKNLCVKVVCEGVETKEQKDFLDECGCDLQQGFLYSRPVEMSVFDDIMDCQDVLFANIFVA